jgi:hypothetical protein
MPGTATQLYPTDGPRVNGYRSVRPDSGIAGAVVCTGRERLAWGWQEGVNCTAAWFPQGLPSWSSRKLLYPSLLDEVTGRSAAAKWGTGFGRGAVLMDAGNRVIIGGARPAGLGGSRRWAAALKFAGPGRHGRGKA